MGFCENYLRLPLCEMDEAKEKIMLGYMRDLGIEVK